MPLTLPTDATTGGSLVQRLKTEGFKAFSALAEGLVSYRDDKRTHPSTLTRWATRGVKLAGGTVLKLEAVRINGRLVSSQQALIRFLEAQQDGGPKRTVPTRTPAERKRASEAAEQELIAAGV